jgi:hypothetical protein
MGKNIKAKKKSRQAGKKKAQGKQKAKAASRKGKTKTPWDKKRKYSGLDPKLFSKIKQEFHDLDYIDKLTEEQKAYLNAFITEWLGANMNHSGKKFHKKVAEKRAIWRQNNKRNWDVYSIGRATGRLEYGDFDQEESYNPEDDLIDMIDGRNQIEEEIIEAEFFQELLQELEKKVK